MLIRSQADRCVANRQELHATEEYEMNFTPKILALVCTYCTYTAADMAGSARMQYPATVRIIKYLCTGRIDIIHILKGFEAGADAIFVGG
jgi:F420-non-reducing hydrogenase iron-sulfur subunit